MSLRNTSYFNPTLISGCTLWLDAADSSTITIQTGVSQWNDKSGQGRHVTQSTTSLQPVYSSASNAIVFNSNAWLGIPNALASITPTYTIFVVDKRASASAHFFIGMYNSTGANVALILGYNGSTTSHHTTAHITDCQVTIPAYAGTAEPRRLARYDYTGTIRDTYINAGQLSTIQSFSATLPTWNNANIGAGYYTAGVSGIDWWYVGNIHEVIFYNNVLTTTQAQQVEGYLAWKWGLTPVVPVSHPYSLTPSFGLPSLVPNAPAKTTLTYANHPVVAINGCALWFDGADPLGTGSPPANGTSLSTWVNKGITPVTLAHGTSQPTYSANFQNGLGSVSFNNNYFSAAYSFNLQTKSAFIVCSQSNNATDSPQGILSFYGSGLDTVNSTNGYGYQATQGGYGSFGWLYNIFQGGSTGYYIATGTAGANTPMGIYGNVFSNQFEQTFKDGSSVTNFTISTTPGTATNLMVGARLIGGGLRGSFFGNICEIIVYNIALSSAQRQTIEGYLAQKWGLTANLPAGHPYKSSFPLFPSPVTGVRRVANRRWSPLTPGNCQLWLDAADSSTFTFTTGNFISVWRDKSTFNNGGTVNTTPKPFLRVTSPSKQSSLFFNGTCGIPLGSSFTSSLCSNFIIVFAPTPAAQLTNAQYAGNGYDGQMLLINGGAGGGEIQIQPDSMRSLIGSWKVSSFPSRVESFCIGQFEFNYGTLLMNLWQNGTLAASTAFSNGTATAPTQLGISEYFATFGVAPYIGDVAEIIYYSVSLSNPQRQQVEGYLAWKWGLKASLPSSHPYKLFPPSP